MVINRVNNADKDNYYCMGFHEIWDLSLLGSVNRKHIIKNFVNIKSIPCGVNFWH